MHTHVHACVFMHMIMCAYAYACIKDTNSSNKKELVQQMAIIPCLLELQANLHEPI